MKRSLLITLLCAMTAFGARLPKLPRRPRRRCRAWPSHCLRRLRGLPWSRTVTARSPPTRSWPDSIPSTCCKQMKNFKAADGKQPERVNAIMNGMIAAYDEGQMRDMAALLFDANPEG
jgi:hypothetical protein